MHEYSIIQALVDQVEAQLVSHPEAEVRKVFVAIGEMAGVDIGLLASAYDVFREKTVCERADLEIRRVDANWQCQQCGTSIARGAFLQCPECGLPARMLTGDEIILERIELEVA